MTNSVPSSAANTVPSTSLLSFVTVMTRKRPSPTRQDLPESAALSIIKNGPKSFKGRKLGVLVTDGADAKLFAALSTAVQKAGAVLEVVAPKVGGVTLSDESALPAQQKIDGGPSVLYDAVVLLLSEAGAALLAKDAPTKDFVSDAFAHAKFIGYNEDALPLIDRAGIGEADMDEGLILLEDAASATSFLGTCAKLRLWDRELKVDLDAAGFLAAQAKG